MINRQNLQDLYPLSPMQEGMLHHWLLSPDSAAYREQVSYRVTGALDVTIFERCWNQVLARHDALRTVFVHEKTARPLQMVLREASLRVHVEDLRDRPPSDKPQRLAEDPAGRTARAASISPGICSRASPSSAAPTTSTTSSGASITSSSTAGAPAC